MMGLDSWHSYPSIFALGHKHLEHLFDEPVLVEEKVDGSQFSFGRFADYPINDGFRARSKGAELNILAPEKMFVPAVNTTIGLDLREGWTYRGEFLAKPKHNALAYDRIPQNNIIIFDINTGNEIYLSYVEKVVESQRLGFEVVPILHRGIVSSADEIRHFLEQTSILGGQKIEGVVIKNYVRFGLDKKALMGKFVAEAYKEVHAKEWKANNPSIGDVIERLVEAYKTPARWNKAVQHLREVGQIEDSPRDIGLLMKEVWPDVVKECKDEICEKLWQFAEPRLRRGVVRGLPEWYKEQLLKKQFEGE